MRESGMVQHNPTVNASKLGCHIRSVHNYIATSERTRTSMEAVHTNLAALNYTSKVKVLHLCMDTHTYTNTSTHLMLKPSLHAVKLLTQRLLLLLALPNGLVSSCLCFSHLQVCDGICNDSTICVWVSHRPSARSSSTVS